MRINLRIPCKETTCILIFFKNNQLFSQLHPTCPKKMIKSTIFELNIVTMIPRSVQLLQLCCCLIFIHLTASAQYTEQINSNRPGTSQGAFSVGNNVLQFEGGAGFGKQKHNILNTKTNTFALDYSVRYGLLIEQLEIRLNGRFRSDGVKVTVGSQEQKITQSDFELNTIGAKYLIYDPYKKPKEIDSTGLDSTELENLKSWRKTHRFKLKTLIPAVAAYVGVNFDGKDNPFIAPNNDGISPKLVISTQNNWYTGMNGNWVLVANLIIDRITGKDPITGWIITSTHTIKEKWAVFGEYQGQKSDFYSDNILRFGSAYLLNKDLQLDANLAFNFKDTPSIVTFSFGASYRLDWHRKDEIIEDPGLEGEQEEEELENEDEKDIDLDEFEEMRTDSVKQSRIPVINDFEDSSFRDALEKDLDERRTAERLERERIEQEKIDKKENKKLQKEERRQRKREEKAARKAEKDRIKAAKQKAKMIEDIDAELNIIEQEEGLNNELENLENELKILEQETLPNDTNEQKDTNQQENIDTDTFDKKAEDRLRKEEERIKKEEEKRRKKEEKRRKKEEKMRKKQEKKEQI